MIAAALAASIAAAASLALTAVAIRYASRRGLFDRPGPRRSHREATPRGGGIAIAVAVALGAVALSLLAPAARGPGAALALGVLALAAVGFWDDHRPLRVWWRLGAQLAVAAAAVYFVGGVGEVAFGPWRLSGWVLDLLAIPALVWLVNLFNFMDGIDGIAGTQAAFVGIAFAVCASLAGDATAASLGAIVAGASLGFLPWNFPRARVFMGDAGSYGLGLALGFLFLWGQRQGSFSVWLALTAFAVFVVDATATLLWRLARRAWWYTPHRDHAYQLLVRSGWSHAAVVGGVAGLNLLLIAPALWWARGSPGREFGACVGVLALLAALWGWIRLKFLESDRNSLI